MRKYFFSVAPVDRAGTAPRAGLSGSRPASSSTSDGESHPRPNYWDAVIVFAVALGLRLLFSLLMSGTFDRDEFVYLSLGRAVGNGSVPYRDFPFFHPPGILVVLGALNPVTALWWPFSRLADALIDAVSAVLVWRIGAQLYGRRVAFIAGALYAVNPLVLVSAVRVGVEIPMTALGTAGLMLLITRRSYRSACVAGAFLAAACWIKYPGLLFLPVYLIAAPRRTAATLLGFLTVAIALFFPYAGQAHLIYEQSVIWQMTHRNVTPVAVRLGIAAVAWLGVGALAVVALLTRRNPWWLVVGFATGAAFLVTSTTYTHYFVPVQPFSALLAAPIVAGLIRVSRFVLIAGCLALTGIWAALALSPISRPFVSAWTFAAARPIVRFIDCATSPGEPVLTNGSEFTYLADRPPVAHYFWEYHLLTTGRALAAALPARRLIVLYPPRNYAGYPWGFTSYLDNRYTRIRVGGAVAWLNEPAVRELAKRSPPCTSR